MKTFMIAATALLGASALTPVFAASAEAQTYRTAPHGQQAGSYEQCLQQQRQRQITGAVIGGLLGAVVGAELHDEAQDRDRNRHHRYDRRDRYGHYDRRGRHDRYDRYGRRHHRQEAGNDGAVVAGGAVGALAGAAIAGGNCDRLRGGSYRQSGYGHDEPYYGNDTYYGDDAYYDDDPYADRGRSRTYSTSDGGLLGGPDYGPEPQYDSRRYESQPAIQTAGAYGSPDCRYMNSAGHSTYMCQGADGIWRPANSYR